MSSGSAPNYSVNRTLTRYAGSRRLPQALGVIGGGMYGLVAVALCLLTGAMVAARGAWALLWTPLGLFIGLFVSSQVLLVLLMGLPRAGWLISKGYMRPSVVGRIFLTPLIWLVIMFLVGFFWPSIVGLINNNLALSLGADLGLLAIILSPLSPKARADFLDDFNTTYQSYYTESGRMRFSTKPEAA